MSHSLLTQLFKNDEFRNLFHRWTLKDFLLGRESVWSCLGQNLVFAFSRWARDEHSGNCMVMLIAFDPEVHTALALDFDYITKVETKKKVDKELAKTEIMGAEEGTAQTRLVIGEYARAVACDWKALRFVNVSKSISYLDQLRLWALVQDFSLEKLKEREMKDSFTALLRTCIRKLRAPA